MIINKNIKKIGLALTTLAFCSLSTAADWRLGHSMPPGHPLDDAAKRAAQIIEEQTNGRIKIAVFPSAQLGSPRAMLEAVSFGAQELALDGAGILSQWNPRISVFEAPFLARDFDHLEAIVGSKEGQKIMNELRKKHQIRPLSTWYYGTRHMTNSVRPVNSKADVKGLKIRVPEVKLSLEFANAIGANATPMAFSELYLGLQTGVVDGQENPLVTINAAKMYEVQDHLALTGHLVQSVWPLINDDLWKSLSKADRKIVADAFKTAGDEQNAMIKALEKSLVSELKSKGMQVTEPDRASFIAAMKPVYEKFESVWGKGTFKKLEAIK